MMPREPEKEDTTENTTESNIDLEPEEGLEQALAKAQEKVEIYLNNWQRAQADFVNYKRRSEQEREEIGRYANSRLILSLLPVLDDIERAFTSIAPAIAKTDWVKGVSLIEKKFRSALEAQGLSQKEVKGQKFDPNYHEAALQIKGEEGIVIMEIQKGYMLNDRVLRPAVVAVGNGRRYV